MVDRRARHIKRLGLSVSAVALAGSSQAIAQTQPPCIPAELGYCVIDNGGTTGSVTLASPAMLIKRGTISGIDGVIVNGPGVIPADTPTPVMAIVDNRAGATIAGTGGTATRGTNPLTVINAGTINGNVQGALMYVANGGVLNGNLVLGTGQPAEFGSQLFVQRSASTGVTGSITAGNGIDFWVRSYAASASASLGAALPITFEVEGIEARGAGTTVTTVASSPDAIHGLMLMGDGNIVNRADVSLFNTVGAGFPNGAQIFTSAIGYGGVPETNAFFTFGFVNPANPTQTLANYSLPVPTGDAARLFDNYFQGAAGSSSVGGFGLGLASARRMAAMFGGTLALDHRWKSGCAFVLHLPHSARL
ncbi:ATP-binding protein [Sphingomonas sp. MG17]|uniref:histidine kinase n=1 Tax=Sphingomonas tagetis TaxID=2949092 RepID=A0A9X2HQC1_9SPHN|nr:ATP-binding protein [Sphingomonas tagetis]MCP3732486.1 ATP-binding protein [Sphingomonas tagetis]